VKPVSAGASWKGFEASKNGNIPLTLNLEKIIRHKGHNIAVLRCDYPLPSSNGSVKWFDVDAGDIILSWKYESDEIQGTTVETRTLSEKLS
jgi:hypothetical protein